MSIVNNIQLGRPGPEATNEEYSNYNSLLYAVYLRGAEVDRKEALDEILLINQGLIFKIASGLDYARYGCEFDEVVSIVSHALIETLQSGYDEWGPLIIENTRSIAKRMLYNENRTAGVTGKCYSCYRSTGEQAATMTNLDVDFLVDEPDLADSIKLQQISAVIQEAMEIVSPLERAIFIAHFGDQKSFREIADQLGVSAEAVKKRCQRTVLRLRAHIDPQAIELIA